MPDNLNVSVIIPAYNEGKNIAYLLSEILEQQQNTYSIKEIVVVSDGSTDDTVLKAQSVSSPLIKIIEYKERAGKASRLNSINSKLLGDIIINLDADIKIPHKTIFELLLKPHRENTIDVVCGFSKPLQPTTFIEKVALFGFNVDQDLKDSLGKRAMRYRLIGRIFSCTKKSLEGLQIPGNVATDTYTYFFFAQKKLKIVFEQDAIVYFRLPTTIKDFIKQYTRHLRTNHKRYFEEDLIRTHDTKSKKMMLRFLFKHSFRHPIQCVSFICLYAYALSRSKKYIRTPFWDYIASTK